MQQSVQGMTALADTASISLAGVDVTIRGIEREIQQISFSGLGVERTLSADEVISRGPSVHQVKIPNEFLQGNSYNLSCDVVTAAETRSFQLELSAGDDDVKKEFAATVSRQAGAGTKIAGCVDYFDGREVRGWAFYRNKTSERILVGFYLNNRYQGHYVAELMRADLRKKKLGDGCSGFSFVLPQSIYERAANVICVKPIGARDALRKGLMPLDAGAMLDAAFEKLLMRIDRLIEEL